MKTTGQDDADSSFFAKAESKAEYIALIEKSPNTTSRQGDEDEESDNDSASNLKQPGTEWNLFDSKSR